MKLKKNKFIYTLSALLIIAITIFAIFIQDSGNESDSFEELVLDWYSEDTDNIQIIQDAQKKNFALNTERDDEGFYNVILTEDNNQLAKKSFKTLVEFQTDHFKLLDEKQLVFDLTLKDGFRCKDLEASLQNVCETNINNFSDVGGIWRYDLKTGIFEQLYSFKLNN